MKKLVTITDVTRMQAGRVCVAGYDTDLNCIRPVLPPPGIQESSLYARGKAIVFPFAVVEYDLVIAMPDPPHTEDHRYNPASIRFIRQLDGKAKRELLDKTLFNNIRSIFESPIHTDPGFYIMHGSGPRSLGTIRPSRVITVIYDQESDGRWRYRLGFEDGDRDIYWLSVTDLAWRYYCDYSCRMKVALEKIASQLTSHLRSAGVYLRIGLARGWEKYPDRCYLQVTGVYTFPDYLEGKIYSDFAPA